MDEKNTPKMGHEPHVAPFEMFDDWFKDAKSNEDAYPDAMTLATADKDGRPSARIVLLKGFDDRGFVFTPIMKAARAANLLKTAMRHCASIGKRSKNVCESKVRSPRLMALNLMSISHRAHVAASLAPGHRYNHAR